MTTIFDVAERALAAAVLAAAAPVLMVVSAAVKLTSPGPVLYEPEMLGRAGRAFRMRKFRSMKVNAGQVLTSDDKTVVFANDARLTPIGRYLRVGVDELPQLLNIVRGEMSFVGPRPDPTWVRPRYSARILERLEVRPGITGLAQVLDGRNQPQAAIYWMDAFYVRHRSLALDAAVVSLTIPYLLGVRGLGRAVAARLLAGREAEISQYELAPPGASPQPGYVGQDETVPAPGHRESLQ